MSRSRFIPVDFDSALKFFSALFFVFFFVFSFRATDYYVDDNSNTGDIWTSSAVGNDSNNGTSPSTPKATIANVLSSYVLGANDVIYVDAGTFSETGINIGVDDDGSASGYMTIRGAGAALTIFNTTTSNTFSFSTNGVGYVKVMNLRIDKNTTSSHAVNFSANSLSYIWFENCVLSQAGNNEVVYGDNTSASSNSNITFSNCTLTNSNTSGDADGIELNNNFDVVVVSNSIINLSGNSKGIHINTSSSTRLADQIQINNNTFNLTYVGSFDASGVFIEGFDASFRHSNVAIFNNIIVFSDLDGGLGIYLNETGVSGGGVNIYRNKIRNGRYGINLNANVSDAAIYNNYVSNALESIYVTSGTSVVNMKLYFNSFFALNRAAYFSDFTNTSDIRNNIFYTTSSSSLNSALDVASSSVLASNLNNNLYYAPNGADIAEFGSASYTTLANWQAVDKVLGAPLGEENGKAGNPLFVNAPSNDLDITNTSSLAVSNGSPLGGSYTTDIYATVRSTSTPWIGAFENPILLPIELLSFDAQLENKATHLTWQTASERNNDYFSVERSANGIDWSVIETVEGAGISNEMLSYETFDLEPLRGISYYRLKQTDFDGKTSYSEIRTISNTSELMVLPNPGSGMFYISGLSDRQESVIVVRDITGKEITKMTAQKEMQQLDLSQQPSGVYFVTINAEETIRVIKVTE